MLHQIRRLYGAFIMINIDYRIGNIIENKTLLSSIKGIEGCTGRNVTEMIEVAVKKRYLDEYERRLAEKRGGGYCSAYGLLTELAFDITGQYLLSAGDKHVHVLHNVTGYKAAIADLREKELKATGAAMKERIRQQMNEARDALQKITGDANGFVESK